MSVEYDRLAEAYGRHRKCHEGALSELAGAVGKNSRVLEVGAGTGNYIGALCDLAGCQCWALEPSAGMLEVARERGLDVTFVTGRAEELPFDGDAFDLVFCVDVIHHLTDRVAFVREAFRVLSAGGRLCIVTDSEEIIRTRFPLSEYFPETVEPELVRYPSIAELERLARAAGFREVSEARVKSEIPFSSVKSFEAKAFSALHLISQASFEAGLARLKADLERGPLVAVSQYVMLWATK